MEKICFTPDTEEESVEFFVLEQTRIAGTNYLLVTDTEDGDGEALILKDLSNDDDAESVYEIVSEDAEFDAVSGVFADLLEDIDFVEEDEI